MDDPLIAELGKFLSGATARAIYQSRGATIEDQESFAESDRRFLEPNRVNFASLPRLDHGRDAIELFAMDPGTFSCEAQSRKVRL